MGNLQIKSKKDGKKIFIELSGDIDISSKEKLINAVKDLEDVENSDLEISMDGVDFIDSTGLGALIKVFKHVESMKNKAVLKDLKPNVKKLLKITKLDEFLITEE